MNDLIEEGVSVDGDGTARSMSVGGLYYLIPGRESPHGKFCSDLNGHGGTLIGDVTVTGDCGNDCFEGAMQAQNEGGRLGMNGG